MGNDSSTKSAGQSIAQACHSLRQLWQTDAEPPDFAQFLRSVDICGSNSGFSQLLAVDAEQRRRHGLDAGIEEYSKEFPERKSAIKLTLGRLATQADSDQPSADVIQEPIDDRPTETQSIGVGSSAADSDPVLQSIGRYEVEGVLGAGGFGRVYLARDTNLERRVAIKVPHKHRLTTAEEIDQFLAEARTLASLDHPGVVPIYDFDRIGDQCYVVSKYIDGEALSKRQRRAALPLHEVVSLLCDLADTLGYIHFKGIVHRDIKPSNLLLTQDGKCFVTDFGLALRDFDYGRKPGQMGTLCYMSPEQARGEAHLVDGRSDLFSLGVVMYELLTGTRPFPGKIWQEVIPKICSHDPRPLRQRVTTIPKELERICLKLLAKRAKDRYLTAQDVADDLQHFANTSPEISHSTPMLESRSFVTSSHGSSSTSVSAYSHSDSRQQLVGIIPRGLRSFDQEDSQFFRELLPGPRDRDGIPNSLQFWKHRIESEDTDKSFRVGAIYGPSGSGKSSFIKAGLLPLLDSRLSVVFVEAAVGDTENRLLRALRLRCPDMPEDLDLIASVAWIRRMKGGRLRRRVLIVIDQFEQWLHGWDGTDTANLALGLRQCDGLCLQCILLVRDDFWLGLSRFADVIEVDLIPSSNLSMVDLFDKRHARKVLAEYGRGYARLPDNLGNLTRAEDSFLTQAISGLAEEDKVIPMQLATFSEIMKTREWNVQSLQELGGVEGVGVRFLEESFSTQSSPAQNRAHEEAAQAILRSLLPEAGTNIKGAMRSEVELRSISGYATSPKRFEQVIRILDTELRLVTPTTVQSFGEEVADGQAESSPQRFYQLTHDSLVPAVRVWSDRRQQRTLTGRAASKLADRAEVWTARPESRHLPSWLEWITFLLLTRRRRRDSKQRKMMAVAGRRHATGTCIAVLIVSLLWWGGIQLANRSRALGMIEQLATASSRQVCRVIDRISVERRWTEVPLERRAEADPIQTTDGLRARLALLRIRADDQVLFHELESQLEHVDFETLSVLRDELGESPLRGSLTTRLWNTAESIESVSAEMRFRIAILLAAYDPPIAANNEGKWTEPGKWLVDGALRQLAKDPRSYDTVSEIIRRARVSSLPQLRRIQVQTDAMMTDRQFATNLLIDLLADEPKLLTDVFLDATGSQVEAFASVLAESFPLIQPILDRAVKNGPKVTADVEIREQMCNRQVNAAGLLLQYDPSQNIADLLKRSNVPNTRSGLIERIARINIQPQRILNQLKSATNADVVGGLLLTLGTYAPENLSLSQRDECREIARDLFCTHPEAHIHSSAEWTLRRFGDDAWTKSATADLAGKRIRGANWSVTQQGITMIDVPKGDHVVRISAKEVTMEQYRMFRSEYKRSMAPLPDCPTIQVSWFDAVQFCRWLTDEGGMGENDQCYPEPTDDDRQVYLRDSFRELRGFRLPTVTELRTASMGISKSRFHFGDNSSLLKIYDCVMEPTLPVTEECGRRKPSHAGFFNLLGNVHEWCSPVDRKRTKNRPVFGGKFDSNAGDIIKMYKGGPLLSETKGYSVGFRIAQFCVVNTKDK